MWAYLLTLPAETAAGDATEPETALAVYDEPAPSEPPLWLQADERWGGLPYASLEGTVASAGCGLCCAAMAASYLTGDEITPPELLNQVGNTCIDGGMNHMGLFCENLRALYGIEYTDLWALDDAEAHLRDGWGLLAGMSGQVHEGGRSYEAHVLYVWGCDESGVYVRDPADATLTQPISWERFRSIEWGSYFYAVRGERA